MLTRIVHGNAPSTSKQAPTLPGAETRRVPVLVIRTGGETDRTVGHREGIPGDENTGAAAPPGIDIAGTDYRLTLSEEAIARDREVRGHERAHVMALGGYAASGINYTTQTGPGGESVAVGGRIAVDMAEVPGDPRATLRKARTIYNAATAPTNPSAADMRVAADAYRLMQQAQKNLSTRQSPEIEETA